MKYCSAFGIGIAALVSSLAFGSGGGSLTTPAQSIRCTYTAPACGGLPAVPVYWYCTPFDGGPTPVCAPTVYPNPLIPGCGDTIVPGCSGGIMII